MKEVGNSCNDVAIVGIICGTILLLAIIAVVTYFKQKSNERKALEEAASKKHDEEKKYRDNKKNADVDSFEQNKEDKKLEFELKRQDRVRSLMKEICELTNKGNKGQYNATEANNLFTLYQNIDKEIKLQNNINKEDEQKQG